MTEKVKIEDLYNEILGDMKLHSEASSIFIESIVFHGKTLKEHSENFFIRVPEKMSPEESRAIFLKLIDRIQRAQYYYSIASSVSSAIASGSIKKKADLVAAIIKSYEIKKMKRPGQQVIESLAESFMSETSNIFTMAKIIKEFWKGKLDSLIEIRKCMEQINISQATELKHLG